MFKHLLNILNFVKRELNIILISPSPPTTPSSETNPPPSTKGPVRVHFASKLEESESESELDLDVELEEELNDLVESNDNLKKESPVEKRNYA